MLQRVLFGEVTRPENAELEEMNWREKTALIPLVILAIIMGVGPMIFLRGTEKSVNSIRESVQSIVKR
jgi:NADH-quinone oxidoreductase subunit M